MKDIRQSPQYTNYLSKIGWSTERIDGVNYFIKKFLLIGSLIKIQRPEKIKCETINLLSHKYRAFQIILEPKYLSQVPTITRCGFKLCSSPFLPSKSLYIDLTKSEEVLLLQMHPKTRYNIKIAKRNEIEVLLSKDIDMFINLWHKFRKSYIFFLSLKKQIKGIYEAFSENSDILFAYHGQKILACLLVLYADKIAYYMYAAADDTGKKLFAPTLLTWEGIRLAKRKGCKIFDFEGIYDKRFPIKSWEGFTHFKKSFGGYEVKYPGAFVKTNYRNIFS
jgi:hypothetical protein